MDVKTAAKLSALVGCLVFCNSLSLRFCLDDKAAVMKNPDLLGNTSWSNLLKNDFWGKLISDRHSHKSYRPLTVATFRLNYMLHELQPLGYHLVNVLLHSAVCYLYVLLCGVVFSEVWPALIAGLLFAVHPIHTEAVSGVVGRADLLSALFTLIALFCYRKCLDTNRNGHVMWFVMSLLSTLSAALSKEIGITATVLCFAYELVFHKQVRYDGTKEKTAKTPHVLSLWCTPTRAICLGLFSVSFLWWRLIINQGPPLFHVDNNPALQFPTPLRQLHWSYLCVLNVWLLLSPSQLCAEYAMGTIPPIASLTDPRNLLTVATFASLLSMGCYAMRARDGHHRKLLFALCLMIIPFIPASNLFFPVGFVIAERVLYIPSMGFTMIVTYGAWILITNHSSSPIFSNVTKGTIYFLLITQSSKTFTRNLDWKDNLTLFTSALKVSKTSAKMWNFVGNTYFKAGNSTLAKPFFVKSLEVDPLYPSPQINLVRILKREENYTAAIEYAGHASELVIQGITGENPHYYQEDRKVFLELARLLLLHTNRYEEALKWSRIAAEQFPEWEPAYEIMGRILIALRKYSKAKLALSKALELKGDFAGAHASLGEAHLELGEEEEAEQHFRRAMALDSQDFQSKFQLVKLIINHSATITTDRLTEALTIAFNIVTVEPRNGNVTMAIALLYQKLGDPSLSLEYFDRTIEIDPKYYPAYQDKGRLLYEIKRHTEADEVFAEFEKYAPNATDIAFLRGTNYLAMNELDKARELLSTALALNPEDEHISVNYGIALVRSKEFGEALEVFRKLAREYPSNASYSKQLSVLENRLSQEHS